MRERTERADDPRARDAKGDVKLETKRVDAERQSERCRREAKYERIDVTFVNLSEKDTEVRECHGGGAGRRVGKAKNERCSTCLPFA